MIRDEIMNYVPKNKQEELDRDIMLKAMDEDGVFTRDNTKHHFCVSAWIVDETMTKVLMVYHNIYNSWSWIGGHLDGEMNAKKKILEEIEEETGVSKASFIDEHIISLEVLDVNAHKKRGQWIEEHQHFDVVYLLCADTSEILRVKEDENKAVSWINVEDISEKVREKDMLPLYSKLMKIALSHQR